MLGDTAVAVNPKDARYATSSAHRRPAAARPRAAGRSPTSAWTGFGTGALKITPAHDLTDFEIGRDHDLPTVQVIGPDGRITAAGGPYAGLDRDEARERVVADLRAAGVLEKVEDYTHSVATCYRCGTPIEPLISLQWFMRMDELKAPATEAVRDGRVALRAASAGAASTSTGWRTCGPGASRASSGGATSCRCGTARPRMRRDHRRRAGAAGLPALRRARPCAARPTCSTPGSARRCGRSPPGAGPTRPPTSSTSIRRACSARRARSSSCGWRAW